MAKIKKLSLGDAELPDFKLIAILCHQKDYRLCYELNEALDADLRRSEDDLEALVGKQREAGYFSVYTGTSAEGLRLALHENRNSEQKHLIAQLNGVDFLLRIEGITNDTELNELVKRIKKIGIVNGAYPIDPDTIKNKEYLIF